MFVKFVFPSKLELFIRLPRPYWMAGTNTVSFSWDLAGFGNSEYGPRPWRRPALAIVTDAAVKRNHDEHSRPLPARRQGGSVVLASRALPHRALGPRRTNSSRSSGPPPMAMPDRAVAEGRSGAQALTPPTTQQLSTDPEGAVGEIISPTCFPAAQSRSLGANSRAA